MVDQQFGWDEVAEAYTERFGRELDAKPFDRRILDWLLQRAGPIGPISDLGSGPGQVAACVHSLGAETSGIDLSAEMVQQAATLNPEISFHTGDMSDLAGIEANTFGGIAAFYSIVNLTPADRARAFPEIGHVLRPGGWLLLSFHIGDEINHVEKVREQSRKTWDAMATG